MDSRLFSQELVAEMNHQINSPLAAIRNALYLASCRTGDPELLRYLALAEEEVASISATLRRARSFYDTCEVVPRAQPAPISRRAAA